MRLIVTTGLIILISSLRVTAQQNYLRLDIVCPDTINMQEKNRIKLRIANLTNEDLYISNPKCFQLNSTIEVSYHDRQLAIAEVNNSPICKSKLFALPAKGSIIVDYFENQEFIFRFEGEGVYSMMIKYYGDIFDSKENKVASDEISSPLSSFYVTE